MGDRGQPKRDMQAIFWKGNIIGKFCGAGDIERGTIMGNGFM
jgi:hypothetical protein